MATENTDDNGPTDGQRAGRKRWCGECGDESEQERSRTGGGAGRAAARAMRRERRGGAMLGIAFFTIHQVWPVELSLGENRNLNQS